MKTQDLRSMDDATEIMAQRTTGYQDAEKAKFKDLGFKGRKQEEGQSRALGKTNEKLNQLEAQRKEDVDRLIEKLSQLEARQKEEVDQLNVELGQLKTRTSENVKELDEKLRQAQTDHSNMSDELSMKTAKLDNMIIEKSNERVMTSLT